MDDSAALREKIVDVVEILFDVEDTLKILKEEAGEITRKQIEKAILKLQEFEDDLYLIIQFEIDEN